MLAALSLSLVLLTFDAPISVWSVHRRVIPAFPSSYLQFVGAKLICQFHNLQLNFGSAGKFLDTAYALQPYIPSYVIHHSLNDLFPWCLYVVCVLLDIVIPSEIPNWWLVLVICLGEQLLHGPPKTIGLEARYHSLSISCNKEVAFGDMKSTCTLSDGSSVLRTWRCVFQNKQRPYCCDYVACNRHISRRMEGRCT
jgi:hypothetical protein